MKNIKYLIILILLILCSCLSRNIDEYDLSTIKVVYDSINKFDDFLSKKDADALILLHFYHGFEHDSSSVWVDNHLLFNGELYTDPILGEGHVIVFEKSKNFKDCTIKINNMTLSKIKLDNRYNHIVINFIEEQNKIIVRYTNIRPRLAYE